MKFTRGTIAELDLKAEAFHWDDEMPGFGIRVRGKGARWVVQYRVGAKQRRESLGDIRKITLEAARDIARQKFAQVTLGKDPAAEKAERRAIAAAAKLTFKTVAKMYIAYKAAKLEKGTYRKSTLGQLQLHLGTHWAPLNDHPVEIIDRAMVAARLNELIASNGESAAGRARSNLTAMFTWAMKQGLCDKNPVLATIDPEEDHKSRDRILSDAELVAIWKSSGDDDFGRIVRLLILTGCRREEIGGLTWDEVDLDMGSITIPGTRTKNHREHCLPLPTIAMDILRSAPMRAGRPYVFGGGATGFNAWSYATNAMRVRITANLGKVPARWTLHDLRRTMRSNLGKIGIAPHVAEIVINHRKGGVEAIYDRYTYDREIGTALAMWADHLLCLVAGKASNVTTLKRA